MGEMTESSKENEQVMDNSELRKALDKTLLYEAQRLKEEIDKYIEASAKSNEKLLELFERLVCFATPVYKPRKSRKQRYREKDSMRRYRHYLLFGKRR